MAAFLPFIYLIIGWLLGHLHFDIKSAITFLLSRLVIPGIIVCSVATYSPEWAILFFGAIFSMLAMILISRLFNKNPIENLSFCYLNVGGLGMPIASIFFDNTAVNIMVTIYAANSIFGNSAADILLNQKTHSSNFSFLFTTQMKSLVIGILIIPFGDIVKDLIEPIYGFLKISMGVLGMALIGSWLANIKITTNDFKKALSSFIPRTICISALTLVYIAFANYYSITMLISNKAIFYTLALLPPSSVIIAHETRYLGSGSSSTFIACSTFISMILIVPYIFMVKYIF